MAMFGNPAKSKTKQNHGGRQNRQKGHEISEIENEGRIYSRLLLVALIECLQVPFIRMSHLIEHGPRQSHHFSCEYLHSVLSWVGTWGNSDSNESLYTLSMVYNGRLITAV